MDGANRHSITNLSTPVNGGDLQEHKLVTNSENTSGVPVRDAVEDWGAYAASCIQLSVYVRLAMT